MSVTEGRFGLYIAPHYKMPIKAFCIIFFLVDDKHLMRLVGSAEASVRPDNYCDYIFLVRVLYNYVRDLERITSVYMLVSDRANSSNISVLMQVLLSICVHKCRWQSLVFEVRKVGLFPSKVRTMKDYKVLAAECVNSVRFSGNSESKIIRMADVHGTVGSSKDQTYEISLPTIGEFRAKTWNEVFGTLIRSCCSGSSSGTGAFTPLKGTFPTVIVMIICEYVGYVITIDTKLRSDRKVVFLNPMDKELVKSLVVINFDTKIDVHDFVPSLEAVNNCHTFDDYLMKKNLIPTR